MKCNSKRPLGIYDHALITVSDLDEVCQTSIRGRKADY
jgi:hypothetical protein